MMKRKLAALLLAMMMAATACGQTTGTNSNTGTDSPSAADTVKEDSGNESQENSQTETGKTVTVSENGQAVVKTVGTAASVISDKYSNRDKNASWSQTGSNQITFNGNDVSVTGNGEALTGNQLIISAEGTYVLSGSWSDGQIIVEAADTAKVQIVLNGADITSQTGSVLQIKTADKVFLTLADGTVNQMTDAESYADTSETAADAAIYSKTDLTINGGGALTVNGRYKDGIKSKDELTITGGQLTVSAQDDALTGKDSVAILDGSFVITAGGDGIKSSNTTDTTKGWVSIDGDSFKITAGGDGIQAETIVEINDGTFEIVSGGGSTSAAASQPGQMPQGGPGQGQNGRMTPPDWSSQGQDQTSQNGQMTPPNRSNRGEQGQNGQMTPPNRPNQGQQNGQRPPHEQGPQGQQGFNSQWQQPDTNTAAGESNTQSTSSKGVKAGTDLLINGGTMTVNAADDTLHSNGSITIQAGSLTLTSGDDGIHAETNLNITGSAVIDITNSVEGLEAKVVNISGGTVNVNASDDGINATSGTSSDGGFGGGMDQVQEGVAVNISGGTITVNAQGDGLDSNGDVTVSGGTTIVYGPTNNGNGSLDYNGTADINGGIFIAAGSSGMYQGFSQNSSQSSVAFYHNGSAGEQLTLADSAGNVVASFPGVKNYQVVLISTGRLKTGTSYTVYTGGTLSETGSGAVTDGTIKNGTAVMTVTAE